jgi:hypothetical protein
VQHPLWQRSPRIRQRTHKCTPSVTVTACNRFVTLTPQVLEQQCSSHFGGAHPVYASALNNVALMHKHLGDHQQAVTTYLKV